MKKYIIVSALFILISISSFAQTGLDPRYHTYSEIKAELDSLEDQYPQFIKVDSIGSSTGTPYQEPIPIWAAKLSYNANVDEDEPAVLFVGQCHAEEVLGIEITMYMINEILKYYFLQPYSVWLSNLEIWFVPSINPEGLQVVTDSLDTAFRKNKRDCNQNGTFIQGIDYEPGAGNDRDGVDLNRNYSFNWVHGDTLWQPGGYELWDYYRGPAPFSEGGTSAIKDLAKEEHFIFSINWHSSRSGNYSEKVFYSYEWAGVKHPPDIEINQIVGETVAGLIVTEDGSSTYEPSPSRGRKGNAQDWFYQYHGTIQLLIECGTSNLQPGGAQVWLVDDTCERCKVGAYWLLKRALGYQTDAAMLTGHIKDSLSNEPLEAEVMVEDYHASYFVPRKSDSKYGRFWRVLLPGTYNITIRKKGYEDKTVSNITVNNSAWTELEIKLVPLNSVDIDGTVLCDGEPVDAKIVVFDVENDTFFTNNGNFNFSSYQGEHIFQVTADSCVPAINSYDLPAGTYNMQIELSPEVIIFQEDWESGLGKWNINGFWNITDDSHQGQFALTDSPDGFYNSNSIVSIETKDPIKLNGVADDVVLYLWQKYQTEWEYDVCKIEISNNKSGWELLKDFSGIKDWSNEIISLSEWTNESIYLRFILVTDETLVDPGWTIDEIFISSSVGVDLDDENHDLNNYKLKQNFPNPFRNFTTFSFEKKINSFNKDIKILIYNIKGQLVKKLTANPEKNSGLYKVQWDCTNNKGHNLNSGIYFYTMKIGEERWDDIRKCLLIK